MISLLPVRAICTTSLIFLDLVTEQHLVRHTVHKAPLSCFFLLLRPEYLPRRHFLFCVLPVMQETTFHTNLKQDAELRLSNLEFEDTKQRVQKFREFVLQWIACTSSLQKLSLRTVLTWREEAGTYYRHPGSHYREIYLLTAIGLTPGGSIIVHIYTQTVHRTTQFIREESRPCPVFAT